MSASEAQATAPSEPGIYYDVPFEQYVKIDAINNSTLKLLIDKTPLHARHYRTYGRDTQALAFGRAAHLLLLEPERFERTYAVGPNVRRNTNEWKEFAAKAEAEGREPIKAEQRDEAQAFVNAVLRQPVARFVRRGRAEVTLLWRDEEAVDLDVYAPDGTLVTVRHYEPTGLLQKARIDYVHPDHDILCDVKGVVDAAPGRRGFPKAVGEYGYHRQAAMSSVGWETLTGRTPAFTFIAVEKCPGAADAAHWPFPSAAYETQPLALNAGMLEYRNALAVWARCAEADEWPGYMTNEVLRLELPSWAVERAAAPTA